MNDSNNAADLSDCHNIIGNALNRQGRLGHALHQYQRQMDICHAEIQQDANDAYWRHELCASHNCVGGVLEAQGRLDRRPWRSTTPSSGSCRS